jgi:hypothetical protein
MKINLVCKNCSLFQKTQDGFWVSCKSGDLEEKILPLIDDKNKKAFLSRKDSFLSTDWAQKNPNLAEIDSYYFLVSRDGNEILPFEPYLPYAGQWNADNPFTKIKTKNIENIMELNNILF